MSQQTQDWGTAGALSLLSTEMNSLANATYSSAGSAVDLGDPGPFAIVIRSAVTGSGSGSGLLKIYALWSDDNTNFSEQSAAAPNGEPVGVMYVNSGTGSKKIFQISVKARYVKFIVYNNTGAALAASGSTIVGQKVDVNIT